MRCCLSHLRRRVLGVEVNVTPHAEAVMLLTVSFGKSESQAANPLSPTEWSAFASWLKELGCTPGDLLNRDLSALLQDWEHPKVTVDRLRALLNRGTTLGFALERWQRAGLWVLTRSEPEYPRRLKERLRRKAPPVLFGCGNKKLLNARGIAVVGSRHADSADVSFAANIGREAAECGSLVVSGGARGVDQAAMFGALTADGTVIGVLADNLFRSATSAKYRKHLMSGDLTLTSPFNPEVRFFVGNAMARNKYVYCLAEEAVVVSSAYNNGGTWNGALENLKNEWTPLWIRRAESPESGNSHLVELGGRWLDHLDDLAQTGSVDRQQSSTQGEDIQRPHPEKAVDPAEELYAKVRSLITDLCTEPKQAVQMANALRVTKRQADTWIRLLVEDGVLKKVTRPVRYIVREKDLIS